MKPSSEKVLEIKIDDLKVVAKCWNPEGKTRVLALHGWLDNLATFARLAPHLKESQIVAVDLPGHGLSDHRPIGNNYHFVDWVTTVVSIADALKWEKFCLLGHSMGAGISTLVGAVVPDRLEKMILIEGFGPMTTPADETPEKMTQALLDNLRFDQSSPSIYPSYESMVERIMRTREGLSREGAEILAERSVKEIEGGFTWRHDQRLRHRSLMRMTEGQVLSFIEHIRCPTLLLRAKPGWAFDDAVLAERLKHCPTANYVEVLGGHHVHLDHPERVEPLINKFLRD